MNAYAVREYQSESDYGFGNSQLVSFVENRSTTDDGIQSRNRSVGLILER